MNEEDKKPRGWFGQKVQELDIEFDGIKKEFFEMQQTLKSDSLSSLLQSQFIDDFPAFYNRVRKMESTVERLVNIVSSLENRVRAAEDIARTVMNSRR